MTNKALAVPYLPMQRTINYDTAPEQVDCSLWYWDNHQTHIVATIYILATQPWLLGKAPPQS
jgi:hypothetical protein